MILKKLITPTVFLALTFISTQIMAQFTVVTPTSSLTIYAVRANGYGETFSSIIFQTGDEDDGDNQDGAWDLRRGAVQTSSAPTNPGYGTLLYYHMVFTTNDGVSYDIKMLDQAVVLEYHSGYIKGGLFFHIDYDAATNTVNTVGFNNSGLYHNIIDPSTAGTGIIGFMANLQSHFEDNLVYHQTVEEWGQDFILTNWEDNFTGLPTCEDSIINVAKSLKFQIDLSGPRPVLTMLQIRNLFGDIALAQQHFRNSCPQE